MSKKETHVLYASRPSAGFPAPADDLIERSLDINDLVVKNPTATFFVKVEGDSMEEAGIFSGDVLVVDRSLPQTHNMIVVAAVFGEMVVKRLIKKEKQIFLISEQEGYEPIEITSSDDCFIWGVVVGSVRTFV